MLWFFGGHMPAPFSCAIKIALCVNLNSVVLPAAAFAWQGRHGAWEGGHGAQKGNHGAIAAGAAGGVAGNAGSGAMPSAGYNGAPNPSPPPPCHTELRQEHYGYSYHFGEVQVCN
jgi:hypothetical protein